MKSKQIVQITLASIVAITLMTTGIVYADNDDMMKWIRDMMAWILDKITNLQEADVQHDEQIKKLNKQIEELQQENEKQQTQIKQLQDFRDDALADMQTMYDDLDAIMNPTMELEPISSSPPTSPPTPPPEPTPTYTPITIDKSSAARGYDLEFIVNFESVPNTMIVNGTFNDTRQEIIIPSSAKFNLALYNDDVYAGWYHPDYEFTIDIHNVYYGDENDRPNNTKSINQTAYKFTIPIPYNHEIGSHELGVSGFTLYSSYMENGVTRNGEKWEILNNVEKQYPDNGFWYNIPYEVIP